MTISVQESGIPMTVSRNSPSTQRRRIGQSTAWSMRRAPQTEVPQPDRSSNRARGSPPTVMGHIDQACQRISARP